MDLGFGIRRWLADLPHGSSLSSVEEKGKEDENTTLSMLIFNTKRTLFPANPVLVLKKQDMPNEVFYEVAEYLSLKDILALRQVNKHYNRLTQDPNAWFSLFRRLTISPPILAATPDALFGSIRKGVYESLVRRSLYLAHNWSSRTLPPVADKLLAFDAFHRVMMMRFLQGGKYLVVVTKWESAEERFVLTVWDVENKVALGRVGSSQEMKTLKVKYAKIRGEVHIVVGCTVAVGKDRTRVQVFGIPLSFVSDLTDASRNRDQYLANAEEVDGPFNVFFNAVVEGLVTDLDLANYEGRLMLAFITSPRTIVFQFLMEEMEPERSLIILPQDMNLQNIVNAAWHLKLLPWQNSVLVSRFMIAGENLELSETTLFCVEMYHVPEPGSGVIHPAAVGRHFLNGLKISSFEFSDLESHWFSAVEHPLGLLNTPLNVAPPPISIFVTTQDPYGFVHVLLTPHAIPNSSIPLRNGMGSVHKYIYQLPCHKIGRQTWTDVGARPVILPGAYRTIVYTRPRHRPGIDTSIHGMRIMRFFAYRLDGQHAPDFDGPWSTGSIVVEGEVEHKEEVEGAPVNNENDPPSKVLALPRFTDSTVREEMKEGTTAMAWDESTGRLCYSLVKDTKMRMLDFGKPSVYKKYHAMGEIPEVREDDESSEGEWEDGSNLFEFTH